MLNTILFSLAVVFLVIGIHQTITVGFEYSYWIFMLSISMLLLYRLAKGRPEKKKKEKKEKKESKRERKQREMLGNRQMRRLRKKM